MGRRTRLGWRRPTRGDPGCGRAPARGGIAITSYMGSPFIGATAQTATIVSGSPPATSTTVAGLTNGTAYAFRVAATNPGGPGLWARPGQGWHCDHELYGVALYRGDGADGDDRVGEPAGDQHDGVRFDQWDG